MLFIPLTGGKGLVSGLKWLKASGWALNDLLQQNNAGSYLALAHGGIEMVGVLDEKLKGRVYSVAALASEYARANRTLNAAFVFRIPDDRQGQCIMAAVLDGLPVPGYDFAGSKDQVTALYDKFKRATDSIESVLFSDLDALPDATRQDLPGLITAVTNPASAEILSKPSKPWSVLVILAGLIAAGGYFGWQWWLDRQQLEQDALNRANQKTPEQIYQESLPGAFAKAGLPLPEALRAIDYVGSDDTARAGWQAEKMVCSQAEKGCVVTWKSIEPGATYATLVAQTKDGLARLTITSVDTANEHIDVPNLTQVKPISFKALRPAGEFLVGIVSQLQRLAATDDLKITSLKKPEVWPEGAPKVANAIWRGEVSISGDLWLLPMVATLDAKDVAVTSIDVTPPNHQFTMNLTYFSTGKQ